MCTTLNHLACTRFYSIGESISPINCQSSNRQFAIMSPCIPLMVNQSYLRIDINVCNTMFYQKKKSL